MTESRRIMVAEDDDSIAYVLTDLLAERGYSVRRAREGVEALEWLTSWAPEVVLLDLMLPGMDGWAFRAAQRELDPPTRDIPVILVSGAYQAATAGEELNAAAVISKPFDLDDIVNAVESVLDS